MAFDKCPECGETNYEEIAGDRTFECGFESNSDTRTAMCQTAKSERARPAGPTTVNDEAACYRLALLDAAQVAEVLATDMSAAGQDQRFIERCRELASQIKAFAGHSADGTSFEDRNARHRPPDKGLLTFMQRMKPW